jgi:dTDP-4-amino-4,6-dideoxygalactose transaminase
MSGLREVARRGQVLLLEDAAQAHGAALRGAPVGTLGDGAAFSFYPTKNMTTGEGGAVVLEDPDAVRTVRLLRNQGMDEQYEHEVVGFNLRMTEMSAALGRVQLERFAELTATRQGNAARYDAALAGGPVQAPVVRDGATHVYHQYTVRTGERDALADRLHALGVQSRVYYPTPLHQQLPFRGTAADLPETERATREVLSVPVGPHLAAADVECIADALGATT